MATEPAPFRTRYSPPSFVDQLPPRPVRQTHTYAVLEIAAASFNDILARLTAAGVHADYLQSHNVNESVLVFGGVGFIREKA